MPGPRRRASTPSRRAAPPTSSPRSTSRAQHRAAPGRQGRRPQLPGHVERGRFAAGLDPRHERRSTLHDAFVAAGLRRRGPRRCARSSVGAGAIWAQVYDAVTTRGGGYVQGGGCMTVGVAGLVQSGGFGSFSKAVRPGVGQPARSRSRHRRRRRCASPTPAANPICSGRLKGGGGGSLGIVTRLTLRVHPLPEDFGAVNLTVQAASPAAFRRLVGLIARLLRAQPDRPALGRADPLAPGQRAARSRWCSRASTRSEAQAVWQPFLDALDAAEGLQGRVLAAEDRLDVGARRSGRRRSSSALLGFISTRRPARRAAETNVFWPGDQGQAGQFLHGYDSAWLPAALLRRRRRARRSPMRCSPRAGTGACRCTSTRASPARRPRRVAAARDTAINPAVLDAFALVDPAARPKAPAYPGVRRPRARRRRGAPARAGDRAGDGRAAQARARGRRLRLGEQLLRAATGSRRSGARTIARLLAVKDALRPGRAVLRAPRRRAASAGARTASPARREPAPRLRRGRRGDGLDAAKGQADTRAARPRLLRDRVLPELLRPAAHQQQAARGQLDPDRLSPGALPVLEDQRARRPEAQRGDGRRRPELGLGVAVQADAVALIAVVIEQDAVERLRGDRLDRWRAGRRASASTAAAAARCRNRSRPGRDRRTRRSGAAAAPSCRTG